MTVRDDVFMLIRRATTDEARIAEDVSLRGDLMLDSLDLLELILDVEEKFALEPTTDAELAGLLTVGDLVRFVEERRP